MTDETDHPTDLAIALTMSWLANPNTRASESDVTSFLDTLRDKILSYHEGPREDAPAPVRMKPAVTTEESLASPDHILSMINGKPYKMLKRHLECFGFTPERYREYFELDADYPMVAPAHSARRSAIAQRIGLGHLPKAKPVRRSARAKSH